MLQTTNNIFNTSLYQHVTPESMLAWQRVRIANFLARGGKQWYQNMARYNSGTRQEKGGGLVLCLFYCQLYVSWHGISFVIHL